MAKIFVGLPVFNLIDPGVKESHQNIFSSKHEIIFKQVVGASVEHARQILIKQFLETDAQYLFALDADIVYRGPFPDVMDRLISLDKDIVGGIYFYKQSPCLPVYRPLDLQKQYEADGKFPENYTFNIPKEPFEVNWMGNGFKLIKREVVEKIFEKINVPNLPMIHHGEYVSEDWAFDQRAKELGFTVWADPSIKLGHIGKYCYTEEDFKKYQK